MGSSRCGMAVVPKRTLQWDRWQNLIRKAMTFIISRDVAKVKAAERQVVN